MKLYALFTAVILALGAAICGCGTTGNRNISIPAYMTNAVMTSFNDIFDGSWSGVTVYIKQSPYLPPQLAQIGKNPARIVEDTYKFQQTAEEEMDTAPAVAIVQTWDNESNGTVRVVITYEPYRIKGLDPQTHGGTFDYTYKKSADGRLIMKARTKSLN